MYCRICGDEEGIEFYPKQRQVLCRTCKRNTPSKVSRSEFDRAYWHDAPDVADSTKREFYSDYLASSYAVKEYIQISTMSE